MAKSSEALLKEINRRYIYALNYWTDVREQARIDMRYVGGDSWDQKERTAREAHNRPVLCFDELGQYVNDVIGDVRMNKQGISVMPTGSGANDKTAEFRENLIRGIEYRSKAQQAYLTSFEQMLQMSFGAFRINKAYIAPDKFEQEIRVERIPNAMSVLWDPDCKKADKSDAKFWFVLDPMSIEEFKKKHPKARTVDFNMGVDSGVAKEWFPTEEQVVVAEYWYVEEQEAVLLQIEGDTKPRYEEDFPKGSTFDYKNGLATIADQNGEPGGTFRILKARDTKVPQVAQCITNGIEILEENDWDGKYIPLVAVTGKEIYVDDGSGAKLKLMSLIRLARDPQMLYNYYRTSEAEMIGMVPKAPFVGYKGQFEGQEDQWQNVNKKPQGYLEVNAVTDATGPTVLPLPTRPQYQPPIMEMEAGAEAARRAIQAAMGITPLPTAAQRQNEKSGVALKHIAAQQQKGSYQFIDSFHMSIEYAGRIIDDLIDKTYDSERTVTLRDAKDQHSVKPLTMAQQQDGSYVVNELSGEHEITISVGPSSDSQRDAAEDFADSLSQIPGVFPLIGPLLVKLRNLGPIGDEISEILETQMPPAAQAIMNKDNPMTPREIAIQTQAAQQIQQLTAMVKQAQDIIHTKLMELQSKERIAAEQNRTKIITEAMSARAGVTEAEIKAATASRDTDVRAELESINQQLQAAMMIAQHNKPKTENKD